MKSAKTKKCQNENLADNSSKGNECPVEGICCAYCWNESRFTPNWLQDWGSTQSKYQKVNEINKDTIRSRTENSRREVLLTENCLAASRKRQQSSFETDKSQMHWLIKVSIFHRIEQIYFEKNLIQTTRILEWTIKLIIIIFYRDLNKPIQEFSVNNHSEIKTWFDP